MTKCHRLNMVSNSKAFNGAHQKDDPVIISHSRKLIFVHIPKTGGTSIEKALDPHLVWNDLSLGTTKIGRALNELYHERFGLFDHCTVADISAVCGPDVFDDYFSFTLVRHPFDRAVSAYNYIAQMTEYPCKNRNFDLGRLRRILLGPLEAPARLELVQKWPYLSWGVIRAYLESTDFSAFIRHPLTLADISFFPQVDFLIANDGSYKLKRLVKLEEVHSFMPQLSQRIGAPVVIGHENQSAVKHVTSANLAPDDRDFLRKYFNDDFLALEYAP